MTTSGHSVDIAKGYGLEGPDLILDRSKISLFSTDEKGSEAHPISYPMDTWSDFSGGKVAWARSWPLTSI
jgi:hypothetical protein